MKRLEYSKVFWSYFWFADQTKDPKQDTFVEKLVTNVIKNLEVKVTNIHVRYEDSYTNPAKPFSIGVTLRELSCQVERRRLWRQLCGFVVVERVVVERVVVVVVVIVVVTTCDDGGVVVVVLSGADVVATVIV